MDGPIAGIAAQAKKRATSNPASLPESTARPEKRLRLPHHVAAAIALLTISMPAGAQDSVIREEYLPVSIAAKVPEHALRNGPLFKKIKAGLSDLPTLLTDESAITFSTKPDIVGREAVLEAMELIRSECLGPYSIDEGSAPSKVGNEWVQTSWVCQARPDGAARRYFTFEYSPEVDLAFHFKDGKIRLISTFEILPLPKSDFVVLRMNAYDTLKGKGFIGD